MSLSWFSIVRLGLVQMCLGALVVLMTSTLNRLMVVELMLPAIIPGFLVALHYGIQITRPIWGYRSDKGGNRTTWILGGIVILALGSCLAAVAIPITEGDFAFGFLVSIIAYSLIGLGVGASGTSLLALLATNTAPRRRAAAATITWLMMIAGIAITAGLTGKVIEPYSHKVLFKVVSIISILAVLITSLAIFGVESRCKSKSEENEIKKSFREGFKEIWAEKKARNFTIFVFLSMTAYFMQELILEPYAGIVFDFSPGQSTSLSGAQNGGVFFGMLCVGICCTGLNLGNLRSWVIWGCLGSAISLTLIAFLGLAAQKSHLVFAVINLGFFNGMFAVAAIGSMMSLASKGRASREGTRMGIWGAAQAVAAGFGGLLGASLLDLARLIFNDPTSAFGSVFIIEAAIFVAAAALAMRIMVTRDSNIALVPGE